MIRAAAAIVILAGTFAGTAAQARQACVTPAEAKALQFRQLQVELMVATLRCRAADPSFRDNYASYVAKAGPALQRNAGELKGMLARQGRAASHMDKLITELSNEASMRSLYAENYCQSQAERMAHLLALPAGEMESFAVRTIDTPAQLCPTPKVREVKATPATPSVKTGVKTPGG